MNRNTYFPLGMKARTMMECSSLAFLLIQIMILLQGRFDILSLRGSFMPSDDGVTTSRSGGLSVSLSDPDGQVIGGGLAGLLVAASLVQVRMELPSFLSSLLFLSQQVVRLTSSFGTIYDLWNLRQWR